MANSTSSNKVVSIKEVNAEELNRQLIDFVSAVYGDDQDLYLRLFDDKQHSKKKEDILPALTKQCKLDELQSMIPQLRAWNRSGYGVYFVVNGQGQTKEAVLKAKKMHAHFMECDDLPLAEQYEQIREFPLKPSFLIQTAKSVHAYWLISEGDIKRFRGIQIKLISYFGSDPKIKDESRVMRLPTFYHNKNDPVMVQLVEYHPERIYTQDQLEELLPEVEQEKAKHQERFILPDEIKSGERENTLFRYCCHLWQKGYSEDECRQMVRDANQRLCEKSLHDSEMENKIFSWVFTHYEQGKARDRFHKFDKQGRPTGIYDDYIREDIKNHEHLFIMNGKPYVYSGGVYKFDEKGTLTRRLIEQRMYQSVITDTLVSRVYKLILNDASLQRKLSEINVYPDEVINFRNGMLDVRTLKLSEHKPEYYSINQIPHDYIDSNDLKGHTPTQFIYGLIPDHADRRMFYQYCGYMFTKGSSLQKFLVLEGQGDLGKSTVIRMLQYALGDDNYSSLKLQDLNERFFPTQLLGMLANICADIPSRMMEQVDQIKMITGEDDIVGEYKGVDAFKFRSYAKLFFSANKMPRTFEDESGAYYRRVILIRIEQRGKHIPQLEKKLHDEIDCFISTCMLSLHEMLVNGFKLDISERSEAAVRELRKASDTVESFLDDVTIRGADRKEERTKLHRYYAEYCAFTGREFKKNNNFYESLRIKGIKVNDKPSGGVRWARGVEVDLDRLREYVPESVIHEICYS